MKKAKIAKLVSSILLAIIPATSMATLTVYNYTNEDSSVKVTSGILYPCSMDAGVYTPKMSPDGTPGYSKVSDTEINILCKTSKNNLCTANLYASKNCSGKIIGNAALDLKTKSVMSVVLTDTKYSFDVSSNGTVLRINYS